MQSATQSDSRFPRALLYCAILFPAVLASLILFFTSPGLPYQDDFHAILEFALDEQQQHSLAAKLFLALVAQHNEYKLMFEHLLVLAQLGLLHRILIAPLNFAGNAFLFTLPCLYWVTHQIDAPLDRRLRSFFPIACILCSLSYWEMMNWTMTSLQGLPVIFFVMLSILLLIPARWGAATSGLSFLGACASGVLAAMSSANGFFLLPCGLLFLIRVKAYRRAIAWTLSYLPPLFFYLYHYTRNAEPHHRFVAKIFALLCFPGLVFPVRAVACIAGLAIWCVLLLRILRQQDRQNPRQVYFSVWLIFTALVVSFVRTANAPRYSIYSVLFIALCYSYWLESRSPSLPAVRRSLEFRRWVAASALLLLVTDINGFYHLLMRERMIVRGFHKYRANPAANSPQVNPFLDVAFPLETPYELQIMHRTRETGVYALPDQP